MSKLEKIILEYNITNLELFYDGSYNKTYKGFFYEEEVQIRVIKNKITNHENELKLLKNKENIIYIDEEIMIKKWIDGDILNSNNREVLMKIKNVLNNHWNIVIKGISLFNYTEDKSTLTNDNVTVLSHGDLRPKNIIVDKDGNVHLIDFEWIRYTDIYFDLSHLHLYCFFSINDITDIFDVNKEKLEIAIDKVKLFNDKWNKKNLI